MHKINFSLKNLSIIIIFMTVLTSGTLFFYSISTTKNKITKYENDKFILKSQIIADSQNKIIESVKQLLAIISQDNDVKNKNYTEAQKNFNSIIKQIPYITNIGIIGLDGYVEINAENKPAYYGDAQWFKDAIKKKDFSVGDYQIGKTTRVIQVNFGYPVLDLNNKNINNVLYAAVDISYFSQNIIKNNIDPNEIVIIIDRDGNIIARYPDPDLFVGKNISNTSIFNKVNSSEKGTFELDYDNQVFLFNYVHIGNNSQTKNSECLIIGIPVKILFADLNKNLLINLILYLTVIIISIILIILLINKMLVKPVNMLVAFSKSIASGDYNVRSGFSSYTGELGILAKSLDETGGLLGKAYRDLKNSEIRFRSFLNNSPALAYIKDPNGKIIFLNKAYLNFIKQKEWEGKTDYDFWPKNIADFLNKIDLDVLSGKSPIIEELKADIENDVKYWQIIRFLIADADDYKLIGGIFLDVTELKKSQEQVKKHLDRISTIYDINKIIASGTDLSFTLETLAEIITKQLGMDACYIALLGNITSKLEITSYYGFKKKDLYKINVDLDKSIAGRIIFENKPVYVENLNNYKDSINREIIEKEDFVSLYGIPLNTKGRVLGVIELFKRDIFNPGKEWIDYLSALAGDTAIAIENEKNYWEIQRKSLELTLAYNETLEGWSAALDLRDKETEGHTLRVTEMAVALGKKFNLNDEELVEIRRGSLLHDIGKIGIPDNILLKPGPLSEEEWKIMKTHPQIAYRLLSPIRYLKNSLDIPHYHHEKWDGSGYPYGLKEKEIPLAARIFSIADVYDAITSDRPYRKKMAIEEALDYIKSQSGSHFDPEVVNKFIELLNT